MPLSAVKEFGEVRGRDLIKSIAMDGMEEIYCPPDNTFKKGQGGLRLRSK